MNEGDGERREWVKVSHSPGRTSVSVTLVEGKHSVKWAVKAYATTESMKAGVLEARKFANETLDMLIELEGAVQ